MTAASQEEKPILVDDTLAFGSPPERGATLRHSISKLT